MIQGTLHGCKEKTREDSQQRDKRKKQKREEIVHTGIEPTSSGSVSEAPLYPWAVTKA
jgi:hypothetical protein